MHNAYSDLFIDCLINVNCCIVNGRNSASNDFTFVSTRGCSGVDYFITAYELLSYIGEFRVYRASNLIQSTYILGQIDPLHNTPDHSMLAWSFMLDCKLNSDVSIQLISERNKYNVNSIPAGFMLDDETKRCLHNTIQNLESSLREQEDIDKAYGEFSTAVKL